METKVIIYSGEDTDDVTVKMEEAAAKQSAKGWSARKVDMLSSSTLRVTYVRGEEEEEDEEEDDD